MFVTVGCGTLPVVNGISMHTSPLTNTSPRLLSLFYKGYELLSKDYISFFRRAIPNLVIGFYTKRAPALGPSLLCSIMENPTCTPQGAFISLFKLSGGKCFIISPEITFNTYKSPFCGDLYRCYVQYFHSKPVLRISVDFSCQLTETEPES